jgi:hypothetical protein
MVEQNISTALIMEDDSDWDIRIKQQLIDFGAGTRALTQPLLEDPTKYADPTFPDPKASDDPAVELDFHNLPKTVAPTGSPYGDNWDMLWLGACSMTYAEEPKAGGNTDRNISRGRVLQTDDLTVPQRSIIGNDTRWNPYPDHTRIVHHQRGGYCTTAYAVTQQAAREILFHMAVEKFASPIDLMLKLYCQGNPYQYDPHVCLAPSPPLFVFHRVAGNSTFDSDIRQPGAYPIEMRGKAWSPFVRWSTKNNLKNLVRGTGTYEDQYPDRT